MPLKAFEEFAQEPLAFPVGGKVYTVEPIGWEDGVRLTALLDGTEEMPDADTQNRLLMGDTLAQMVADKVPAVAISRALLTCLTDFRLGRDAAERVWEAGLTPEALAPKGAEPDSTPSSSTDEAAKTPTRASGTGTRTSQKKSSPRKAKA